MQFLFVNFNKLPSLCVCILAPRTKLVVVRLTKTEDAASEDDEKFSGAKPHNRHTVLNTYMLSRGYHEGYRLGLKDSSQVA